MTLRCNSVDSKTEHCFPKLSPDNQNIWDISPTRLSFSCYCNTIPIAHCAETLVYRACLLSDEYRLHTYSRLIHNCECKIVRIQSQQYNKQKYLISRPGLTLLKRPTRKRRPTASGDTRLISFPRQSVSSWWRVVHHQTVSAGLAFSVTSEVLGHTMP